MELSLASPIAIKNRYSIISLLVAVFHIVSASSEMDKSLLPYDTDTIFIDLQSAFNVSRSELKSTLLVTHGSSGPTVNSVPASKRPMPMYCTDVLYVSGKDILATCRKGIRNIGLRRMKLIVPFFTKYNCTKPHVDSDGNLLTLFCTQTVSDIRSDLIIVELNKDTFDVQKREVVNHGHTKALELISVERNNYFLMLEQTIVKESLKTNTNTRSVQPEVTMAPPLVYLYVRRLHKMYSIELKALANSTVIRRVLTVAGSAHEDRETGTYSLFASTTDDVSSMIGSKRVIRNCTIRLKTAQSDTSAFCREVFLRENFVVSEQTLLSSPKPSVLRLTELSLKSGMKVVTYELSVKHGQFTQISKVLLSNTNKDFRCKIQFRFVTPSILASYRSDGRIAWVCRMIHNFDIDDTTSPLIYYTYPEGSNLVLDQHSNKICSNDKYIVRCYSESSFMHGIAELSQYAKGQILSIIEIDVVTRPEIENLSYIFMTKNIFLHSSYKNDLHFKSVISRFSDTPVLKIDPISTIKLDSDSMYKFKVDIHAVVPDHGIPKGQSWRPSDMFKVVKLDCTSYSVYDLRTGKSGKLEFGEYNNKRHRVHDWSDPTESSKCLSREFFTRHSIFFANYLESSGQIVYSKSNLYNRSEVVMRRVKVDTSCKIIEMALNSTGFLAYVTHCAEGDTISINYLDISKSNSKVTTVSTNMLSILYKKKHRQPTYDMMSTCLISQGLLIMTERGVILHPGPNTETPPYIFRHFSLYPTAERLHCLGISSSVMIKSPNAISMICSSCTDKGDRKYKLSQYEGFIDKVLGIEETPNAVFIKTQGRVIRFKTSEAWLYLKKEFALNASLKVSTDQDSQYTVEFIEENVVSSNKSQGAVQKLLLSGSASKTSRLIIEDLLSSPVPLASLHFEGEGCNSPYSNLIRFPKPYRILESVDTVHDHVIIKLGDLVLIDALGGSELLLRQVKDDEEVVSLMVALPYFCDVVQLKSPHYVLESTKDRLPMLLLGCYSNLRQGVIILSPVRAPFNDGKERPLKSYHWSYESSNFIPMPYHSREKVTIQPISDNTILCGKYLMNLHYEKPVGKYSAEVAQEEGAAELIITTPDYVYMIQLFDSNFLAYRLDGTIRSPVELIGINYLSPLVVLRAFKNFDTGVAYIAELLISNSKINIYRLSIDKQSITATLIRSVQLRGHVFNIEASRTFVSAVNTLEDGSKINQMFKVIDDRVIYLGEFDTDFRRGHFYSKGRLYSMPRLPALVAYQGIGKNCQLKGLTLDGSAVQFCEKVDRSDPNITPGEGLEVISLQDNSKKSSKHRLLMEIGYGEANAATSEKQTLNIGTDGTINEEVVVGAFRYLEKHQITDIDDDIVVMSDTQKTSTGFYVMCALLTVFVLVCMPMLLFSDTIGDQIATDYKEKYSTDVDFTGFDKGFLSSREQSRVAKELTDSERSITNRKHKSGGKKHK